MITNSPLKPFALDTPKEIFYCKVFSVLESAARAPEGETGFEPVPVYTLQMPSWVNVAAFTHDGYALIVEQQRFGPNILTFETPGGCMDPYEKDSTMAALRELEEETGYTSRRILGLPSFLPNPALHGNRIHFFVALDCHPMDKPPLSPDALERIRVHKIPRQEVLDMARTGRIQHALSALCILLAEPYVGPHISPENPPRHPM